MEQADESSVPSTTTSRDEGVEETELGEEEQPMKCQQKGESTFVVVDSPPLRATTEDDRYSSSSLPGAQNPVEAVPPRVAPPLGGSEFGGLSIPDDFGSEEMDDRR